MPDELTSEQRDYVAKRDAEYGQFVANGPIYHDGALAYVKDQPVPASNVEAHGYVADGLVRRVGEDAPNADVESQETPRGDDIVIDAPAVNLAPEQPVEQPVEHDPESVPDSADPSASVEQ